MMVVDVALFASLASFQPDGLPGRHSRPIEFPDGFLISQVIEMLALPDEPRVIFVNGRHAEERSALRDGDRLAIFPPVGGG
ncbi:MAG: molybdopterin synthase sulfur carrier subunit [Actinobacteria bacterium HGW-Actinobacteria-6]|nr:MAG: molybdopterin synthase sulfur carrier subunit [Actinobacteria bacterium HGW-Actinobacteria-6]